MSKKLVILTLILPLAVMLVVTSFGCKGKVEQTAGITTGEVPSSEELIPPMDRDMLSSVPGRSTVTDMGPSSAGVSSPAMPGSATSTSTIAIPAPIQEASIAHAALSREQEIQKALKNAGFYLGEVDGKIGPQSKRAIEEFQRAKGLDVDGKVGPKTWAQLESYLTP